MSRICFFCIFCWAGGATWGIPLENAGFELPGTVKQTDFEQVPGWTSDDNPSDSGVEQNAPTEGSWHAFLQAGVGIYQTTLHAIAAGEVYAFRADVGSTFNATSLTVSFYYEDGGLRTAMDTFDLPIAEAPFSEVVVFSRADDTPASIGNQLGIEIRNTSSGWAGVDHVRLELSPGLFVDNPSPSNGEVGVPVDSQLSWNGPTLQGITYDLTLGTDPNIDNNPQVVTGTTQSVYSPPSDVESQTTYYWRITLHSGAETVMGPTWSFTTQSTGPAPQGSGPGNLAYAPAELFTEISQIDAPGGYGYNTMYLLNGYMLTLFAPDSGRAPGGFQVYDLGNPRSPTLVHEVFDTRTQEFRENHAMGFWLTRDDAHDYVAIHTGRGMEVWDFKNVLDPIQVSKLALPGINFGDYDNAAWMMYGQAPYMYISGANHGIFIVDISDPANPQLVERGGGKPNPVPLSELGGFRVGPIFGAGNRLVITNMETTQGLAVLDISDPNNPVPTAVHTSSLPFWYGTAWSGDKLILATRNANAPMQVFDTSNPSQIVLENDSLQVTDQLYAATQDQYVMLGCQAEIVKVDISDPDNYTIVGRGGLTGVSNPDFGQVTFVGNLCFIGNDHGTGSGFVVHQTTPDTTPPVVTFSSPADNAVNQALTSRIGFTFSDNILMESVHSGSFMVEPILELNVVGDPLAGTYSASLPSATFWPDEPLLPNTTYRVTLVAGGIKDWLGNALAEDWVTFFSTGPDLDVPEVTVEPPVPQLAGSIVTLTAQTNVVDSGVEFSWDFGDGTPITPFSTANPIQHTYSRSGHYTVVVTMRFGDIIASDATTVTIHNPLTVNLPQRSSTIVLDETVGRLWVVNADNDTVTSIHTQTNARLWETSVGDHPRTLARTAFEELWVVNQEEATISVLAPYNGVYLRTIVLPFASRPYGIVTDPTGQFVFVSLQATGQVLKLDAFMDQVVATATVGPDPRGLAVTADGTRVLVTRFVSADNQAEVYALNAGDLSLLPVVGLALDTVSADSSFAARGLPNYLANVTISPDGLAAWVPSKKDNIVRGQFRDGNALTFETSVRAIASRITMSTLTENTAAQIDFDNRSQPSAIAFSPLGDYAFVALQGSNKVAIHDAYDGINIGGIDTELAPQGLVLSHDGRRLYVHNFMSRSVQVFDTTDVVNSVSFSPALQATIPTVAWESLSTEVLRGKQIFYNAADARMSRDGYLSCAVCHIDGGQDGRIWDFTDRGEGLRNTVELRGRRGTGHGLVHLSGNFDEIQDFEHDMRNAFGGTGLMSDGDFNSGSRNTTLGDPKAGVSPDLDALAAYVTSLNKVHSSPYRNEDGTLTPTAQTGQQIFNDLNCISCHTGSDMTDSQVNPPVRHDVGTLTAGSGMRLGSPLDGIDTPTLRGIWETPPYLHDGSAATVMDVLTHANAAQHGITGLTPPELEALEYYLLSLDDRIPVPEPTITITSPFDGATVGPVLQIEFVVSNWTIAPGQDHFHYFINDVDQGPVYSTEPLMLHDLDDGTYTVRLQLAQADHTLIDVQDSVTITLTGGAGVTREVWTGIAGNPIVNLTSHPDYPDNPDLREVRSVFEGPTNAANAYGSRMHGFVRPPQTGDYTFWIASDDNGELWLSTDSDPDKAVLIASVPVWTNSREWSKFPSQQSTPIILQADRWYYIRALQKEGNGGDNLAVGWQGPGIAVGDPVVITGQYLKPFNLGPQFSINPILFSPAWENRPYLASISSYGSDPEGDDLFYSKVSGPDWVYVAPDGDLFGLPSSSDLGENQISVEITDSLGATDQTTVIITVENLHDGAEGYVDFAALQQAWLRADCQSCNGLDLNGDGTVDFRDFNWMLSMWLRAGD